MPQKRWLNVENYTVKKGHTMSFQKDVDTVKMERSSLLYRKYDSPLTYDC